MSDRDETAPKVYTPDAFAAVLNVNVQRVWKMIRESRIESRNVGTEDRPRYRIPATELEEFTVRVSDLEKGQPDPDPIEESQ